MISMYSRIKIITYNIHSGKNVWMVPQLNRIIKFLKYEQPHIIGVQEIHENNKKGMQFSILKHHLNINGHFGPNVSIGEGNFGIATFCEFPIIENKHFLLPKNREQRGFIDTKILINHEEVHILNTHLSLNSRKRTQQLNEIKKYLSFLKSPYILIGDLNTTYPDLEESNVIDAAKEMKKEHLSTLMLSKKRIDYLFVSNNFNVIDYKVLPVKMSDHYPVVVEVTFSK